MLMYDMRLHIKQVNEVSYNVTTEPALAPLSSQVLHVSVNSARHFNTSIYIVMKWLRAQITLARRFCTSKEVVSL